MAKFPFLSDEWVGEARRIYSQAEASSSLGREAPPAPVRVNLVVTGPPFAKGDIDAHADTSGGSVVIDTGHLDQPDVTVSLDYATARSLFVSGDVQAALQAFLNGRIKVDGDLTKLLDPRSGIWPSGAGPASSSAGAEAGGPTALGALAPAALDLAAQLQAITE